MGYWEKRARKLEKEKQDNEQFKGCAVLILIVIGAILYAFISSVPLLK